MSCVTRLKRFISMIQVANHMDEMYFLHTSLVNEPDPKMLATGTILGNNFHNDFWLVKCLRRTKIGDSSSVLMAFPLSQPHWNARRPSGENNKVRVALNNSKVSEYYIQSNWKPYEFDWYTQKYILKNPKKTSEFIGIVLPKVVSGERPLREEGNLQSTMLL